ncbi:hypothetical protein L4174_006785 [Photobacterium sp. CCB-ST2H9]|uniref:hypothetical protein n=1 Tax=Photobacterium sp. CCB-ST2H9 TaxID=2912855 RepID=UPI0020C65122|nr:hypothetical protein [Photobacterium sp. CCB-ST2H9]UTM58535.1 hypothetical protein L4174_006785 [Photobacterium sp. CCB-ST2H9]
MMDNSIGVLLILFTMLVVFYALNRFCVFMKEAWVNKIFNWALILQCFLAFAISIMLFLFISNNTEMLNIKVSPANPPVKRGIGW